MFITLEHKNVKKFVKIDDISLFSSVVSGENDEHIVHYFRLKDGSEHELSKDGFAKLHKALIECEETLEELPLPTNIKPSDTGVLLNQLHALLGGRGDAKLTTDRKARLNTRMKDFSKEELIIAATNLGNDEFMQGGNDNGKRYGTIDYLLRTSANINKWLEEQPEKKKGMF